MSIETREHTLDNGLRIVAEVDRQAVSAAAGFFVRTGARDEAPSLMGISHFLEHMVFRGAGGMDGEAIDRAFEDLGAANNAWTSHEVTAFHAHALPPSLDKVLDLLAALMRPDLKDDDLDDERPVILEEIAMYDDQPFSQLWESVTKAYYGTHAMGHRVLGSTDTVKAITPRDMRQWHTTRYGSDCITLAMAGAMDFDAMVQHTQALTSDWAPSGAERSWDAMDHHTHDLRLNSDRVTQSYLIGLSPAPSLQDDRRYSAAVLSWLAGHGDGSMLHWALVDNGLAEEAHIQYEGHDRSGVFASWAVCEPGAIDEVDSTLRRVLREAASNITNEDLARARSMIATSITRHGELPAGRMQRLGRRVATCGDVLALEEELAKIEAVSRADLSELVDDFPPEPVVGGRLLPS
jgi:predicted Zn-dependent peptidase